MILKSPRKTKAKEGGVRLETEPWEHKLIRDVGSDPSDKGEKKKLIQENLSSATLEIKLISLIYFQVI